MLEFPEVFLAATSDGRGFDAILGNPPFRGGKLISGVLGTDYREYLVRELARDVKGHADLSAYFSCARNTCCAGAGTLSSWRQIRSPKGIRGKSAGSDHQGGLTIYRAVPSRPWPGEAALEVAHVWMRDGSWSGDYILEDRVASGITSSLTEPGRVEGKPYRLAANADKSFIGSYVLGMGFVLDPEQAKALIKKDKRNKQVLFPYLVGADLNSEPDQCPTRWVINFHDWPLDAKTAPKGYDGPVADDFADCLEIVTRLVRPERQRRRDNGDYALRSPLPQRWWWHYADKRPGLYAAIAGLDRVLVTTQTSSTQMPALSRNGIVFGHKVVVFATDSMAQFAVQSSAFHREWVLERGSTMRTDAVYTPSDCFDTFAFPALSERVSDVGRRYNDHRASLMRRAAIGITPTYGRFHDPGDRDAAIQVLRELHTEMDHAIRAAYAWDDLDLEHGFHQTKQGLRFSVSEKARKEILARLLLLNHERYGDEVGSEASIQTRLQVATPRPSRRSQEPKRRPPVRPRGSSSAWQPLGSLR